MKLPQTLECFLFRKYRTFESKHVQVTSNGIESIMAHTAYKVRKHSYRQRKNRNNTFLKGAS